MRKNKWMLSTVGLIAAGIWGSLLYMIVFDTSEDVEPAGHNMEDPAESHETAAEESNEENDNEQTDDFSNEKAETDGDKPVTERGIYPGEFADIAPDGIVSVEDVLERVAEEEGEYD